MRAVVVVEYEMDENAPGSPFTAAMEELRERLPSTEAATAKYVHIGIGASADAVMAVFEATP